MDLIRIMETSPTQVACITYLERLRWQDRQNVRSVNLHTSNAGTKRI